MTRITKIDHETKTVTIEDDGQPEPPRPPRPEYPKVWLPELKAWCEILPSIHLKAGADGVLEIERGPEGWLENLTLPESYRE